MTEPALSAEGVRRFFEHHLFFDTGGREHVTLLFHNIALPKPFLEGLDCVAGTRLITVDVRQVRNRADVLQELYDPSRRYISLHDYCDQVASPDDLLTGGFARGATSVDYTSFEFPRFDLHDEQVSLLLARFTAGDPIAERAQAELFFQLLGNDPGYSVSVRSGPDLDRMLTLRGPFPWMELCGPLAEGDIRFAPGSELFYNGSRVDGTLYCAGGINLLPLRSVRLEEETCRALLELGRHIPEDPLDLDFVAGRLAGIRSRGPLAQHFMAIFRSHEAFSWAVEVGIGMAAAAGPLIRDWAAPSNEAVPGVHVGLGADPGNPWRFSTNVHLDFVAPDVQIAVNGQSYFERGTFVT